MLIGNDIVLTHSLLKYLASHGGTATLQELARHFGISWQRALDLLWAANLIDIPGVPEPFELHLPTPASSVDSDPDADIASPESWVTFGDHGSLDMPPLALTLDEVMMLVAVIDRALEVTPPGEASTVLSNLRATLVASAEERHFGSALWKAPEAHIGGEALQTLIRAIEQSRYVNLTYHRAGTDLHESITTSTVIPMAFVSGTNPSLRAVKEGAPRQYRLDRIGEVSLGEKVGRFAFRDARAALEEEDRAARSAQKTGEGRWNPSGREVRLTITRAGLWAAESLPDTEVTERGDKLVLAFRASSEEWLMLLLLQLGNAVVALEPPDVARRLTERSAQLLKETL